MKPITLVNQVDDFTCVYACIAMVSNVSIDSVIKAAGHQRPLSMHEELALLAHFGRFVTSIPYGLNARDGLLLVSVPSLNKDRTMHRIVLDLRNDAPVVLDPQCGRENRRFYATEDYLEGRMAWMEQCVVFSSAEILEACER